MKYRFSLFLLLITCLFFQTSCGIAAAQLRRAGHLLKAPVRAISMEQGNEILTKDFSQDSVS